MPDKENPEMTKKEKKEFLSKNLGFLNRGNPEIIRLQKEQKELNNKLGLLNKEARRLRDEIASAEKEMKAVGNNQEEINKATQQIRELQEKIQKEVDKLSKEVESIASSTRLDNISSTSTKTPPGPPVPPPPPPPPPPKKMDKPVAKANKTAAAKSEPPQINMADVLTAKLNKRENGTEKTAEDKEAEDIIRYKKANERKQHDIDNLLTQINKLSSQLETSKASQGEYQQASQGQVAILEDLNTKKRDLENKLQSVSVDVDSVLEKLKEKRAQEEKAQPPKAEIGSNPIVGSEAPPPPPPPPFMGPPPPPPPPTEQNIVGAGKPKAGTEAPLASASEKKKASSSPEKPALDLGGIQQGAMRRAQRVEAQAIKDDLIDRLINVVNMEKNRTPLTEDQQRLKALIGNEEYKDLEEIVEDTLEQANSQRKESIDHFIEEHSNKDGLLDFTKEARREEAVARQKQEAAEALKRDQEREERARITAEKQKIKAQQEAEQAKIQLTAMGAKEGTVDTEAVINAQREKENVIQSVNSKRPVIKQADDFLGKIDELLNEKMLILQKAEESRMEAQRKAELITDTGLTPETDVGLASEANAPLVSEADAPLAAETDTGLASEVDAGLAPETDTVHVSEADAGLTPETNAGETAPKAGKDGGSTPHHSEKEQKLTAIKQLYKHATLDKNEARTFLVGRASTEKFSSLEGYSSLKGDNLKTQVLMDLKDKIDQCTDLNELQDYKKSDEYKLLATAQGVGLYTRFFSKQTSSQKIIDDLIDEKTKELGENKPSNKA
jgi:hypothetical protein